MRITWRNTRTRPHKHALCNKINPNTVTRSHTYTQCPSVQNPRSQCHAHAQHTPVHHTGTDKQETHPRTHTHNVILWHHAKATLRGRSLEVVEVVDVGSLHVQLKVPDVPIPLFQSQRHYVNAFTGSHATDTRKIIDKCGRQSTSSKRHDDMATWIP